MNTNFLLTPALAKDIDALLLGWFGVNPVGEDLLRFSTAHSRELEAMTSKRQREREIVRYMYVRTGCGHVALSAGKLASRMVRRARTRHALGMQLRLYGGTLVSDLTSKGHRCPTSSGGA